MAKERYAGGNTLASFFRSSTGVVETTAAGRFDSAFVPNAIFTGVSGDFFKTYPFVDATSTTDIWVHFEANFQNNSGDGGAFISFQNSTGVTVFQIIQNSGTNNFQMQYWNGGAFVNLGGTNNTAIAPSTNTQFRFDMHLTCGLTGKMDVYRGGTLVWTNSGLNAAVNNVAAVTFRHSLIGSSQQLYRSQIMVCNYDSRDLRYTPQLGLALGGDTDGTGAVTDINEAVLDETTSVSLPTSGNKRSFTHSTFTLPAGYMIESVWAAGRGRINGSGPTDGKFGLRSTSLTTDHLAGGNGFNTGYEPRGANWPQNPDTGSDWTAGGYNDHEIILAAA